MAHVNLIAMYGDLGLPDKAEEHFREAVKLDPGWAEVYYNWGLAAFARATGSTEASETFQKAIEVNPNYANAYVQLGQILDEAGRMSEVSATFSAGARKLARQQTGSLSPWLEFDSDRPIRRSDQLNCWKRSK